jgi:hypothetical protein
VLEVDARVTERFGGSRGEVLQAQSEDLFGQLPAEPPV